MSACLPSPWIQHHYPGERQYVSARTAGNEPSAIIPHAVISGGPSTRAPCSPLMEWTRQKTSTIKAGHEFQLATWNPWNIIIFIIQRSNSGFLRIAASSFVSNQSRMDWEIRGESVYLAPCLGLQAGDFKSQPESLQSTCTRNMVESCGCMKVSLCMLCVKMMEVVNETVADVALGVVKHTAGVYHLYLNPGTKTIIYPFISVPQNSLFVMK